VTLIPAEGPFAAAHGWLWLLALLLALGALVVSLAGFAARRELVLWLDRLLIAFLAVTALEELLGLAVLATGSRPPDALHLLYGVLTLLAAPLGRYAGRAGSVRRRTAIQAFGWAVTLAFLARLLMTGAG
jgi:hypothetical protein